MLRFLLYMHAAIANSLRLGDRLNDRGATAVEYGLIVTLIAVVIIGVVTNIGTSLRNEFQTVVNAL
jgi:pilus assembly protein Flp/PilA